MGNISKMSNSTNKNSNTAVADAVSGVIGSLIAMITFYPLDVLKTNIQASSSHERKIANREKIDIMKIIKKQFKGMNYKIVNTIISNYIFFWVFSWLQYKHKRRYYLSHNTNKNYHLSIKSRLGLSSLAAMVNIFVTLPFDVLSTRRQIADHDTATIHCNDDDGDILSIEDDTNVSNDTMQTNRINRSQCKQTTKGHIFYDCNDEEKKDDAALQEKPSVHNKQHRIEISNSYTNNNTNIPRNIIQSKNNLKKSTLENVLSLWSGIGPAIILCSNPAIHHTFYDVMKLYALQQRKTKSENNKLSMNEAFCIGFLAKLLATI